MQLYTETADWFAENLSALESRHYSSEEDVVHNLVYPALTKVLGFQHSEIHSQNSASTMRGRRIRLDLMCKQEEAPKASLIVEVKKLGTNLAKRAGKRWDTAPIGQLLKYLEGHWASGDGTWGIVTNGIEWVIVRREGPFVPRNTFKRYEARSLAELKAILQPVVTRRDVIRSDDASAQWLELIVEANPRAFVQTFTRNIRGTTDIAWGEIGATVSPAKTLFDKPITSVYVACLRLEYPDGLLTPQDSADTMRSLRQTHNLEGSVLGIAFTEAGEDRSRRCRGFVWRDDELATTTLIDPDFPGSRAQQQFSKLAEYVKSAQIDAAFAALSSTPLKRQFHEEVSAWFNAISNPESNDLLHLIRVMFAKLLQERGILPDDALWRWGNSEHEFEVHSHILWLFGEVLAVPIKRRKPASDEWKAQLIEDVPFLNGSLFEIGFRAFLYNMWAKPLLQ